MNTHPYLRAFLAGIFVPTLILPVFLAAFIVLRLGLKVPIPIERGLVFPMALVPSVWGLWSVLWLISRERTHLNIGAHGAILPLVLAPSGALVGRCVGVVVLGATGVTWFNAFQVPYALILLGLLVALAVYYLVWKYIVGFLNSMLGIA